MPNNKTVYLIFGDGEMPRRELRDALDTVLPEDIEASSVVLVATNPKQMAMYEAIADREEISDLAIFATKELKGDIAEYFEPSVYDDLLVIGDVDEIVSLEGFDHGEALVLLESNGGVSESDLTKELLAAVSLDGGYRIRALNQQLFEIDLAESENKKVPGKRVLKSDKTPKVAEPKKDVEVPDILTLTRMSRNDIKQLGKDLGVEPTDWRSNDSIIDAIVEKFGDKASGASPAAEQSAEESLAELQDKFTELGNSKVAAEDTDDEAELKELEESCASAKASGSVYWSCGVPLPSGSLLSLSVNFPGDEDDPLGLLRVSREVCSSLKSVIETYEQY